MACRSVFLICLILLSVTGCGTQSRLFCNDDSAMQIGIGGSVYAVAKAAIINPENASGLIISNGDPRYCQRKGSDSIKARQVYFDVPSVRFSGKKMLVGILAPDSFIDSLKPKWPAISAEEIAGFEFGVVADDKAVQPNMPASIRLKSGETRSLTFWCGWTDQPLNDHKGGWIGLCRPILPLSDGNFVEISSGGTPDDDLAPIGLDIVQGLREAERLVKAARALPGYGRLR